VAQYTGFAFPFQKNETGLPAVSTDEVLIKQSILQILLTGVGERIMRPTFGSNVYRFVFEPNDTPLEALIQTEIKDALSKWEPRVALQNVTVVRGDPTKGEDPALITVTVFYIVLLTQNTGTATLTFNGP
jgi:Bacteriophage baseplate protein W